MGFCSVKLRAAFLLAPLLGLACASTKPFTLSSAEELEGVRVLDFQHIRQNEPYDCGEGALAIVMTYWGQPTKPETILQDIFSGVPRNSGTVAADLKDYAERKGLRAFLLKMSGEDIRRQIDLGRPVIVCRKIFGGMNHYEVVVGYDRPRERMILADPADEPYSISLKAFDRRHKRVDQFTLLVAVPEDVPPEKE